MSDTSILRGHDHDKNHHYHPEKWKTATGGDGFQSITTDMWSGNWHDSQISLAWLFCFPLNRHNSDPAPTHCWWIVQYKHIHTYPLVEPSASVGHMMIFNGFIIWLRLSQEICLLSYLACHMPALGILYYTYYSLSHRCSYPMYPVKLQWNMYPCFLQ